MRSLIARGMLVAALALAAPALAQNAVPPPQNAVPPAVPATQKTPPPYLLAGDDVISINVVNFSNLCVPSLVIPPDGKIAVPLLEPFSILGMSQDDVARTLTDRWRKYVINPAVSVSLVKKRQENVLFFGFITHPGTVEYRDGLHLIEALAQVGGAEMTGDLSKLTITHKTGEKQTLDLSHPETRGGTEADLALAAGDVIYVPEKRDQFSVLGEVEKPGSYDYKENMTVLDALTAVGGIKETADLNAATLIHEGKESKIDLEGLLRHGEMSVNVKLASGDRLMVPEIRNRTYVYGAVGRPGWYTFKPGDRVLDALNGCGGPNSEANLSKVNVIHIDKAKNTATVVTVDIDKFLKKGDTKPNVALEPGDVLFIPNKKHAFSFNDILGVLSGMSLVGGAARLLTKGIGQ
ncbi:MAG TPA: SLBB domain-containing protein [Chthonomonadaceae bacterium]|nr:SLBB domain-containing protein [Chthonomonadaceae bacterium]